jgi:putative ABC transport system permease protein
MQSFDARLLRFLDDPRNVAAAAAAAAVLLVAAVFRKQVLFNVRFMAKSLARNPLRTGITVLATMALVFIVTIILSFFDLLDQVTTERAKDFKAIMTERWQIPSQMPIAYANELCEGAPSRPGDYKVDTANDSMTWGFYGGTIDKAKNTRENLLFFFCMEPGKLLRMMDGLDQITAEERAELDRLTKQMEQDKRCVIIGREKLASINKQVGETITVGSINYKDIDLESKIIGTFPDGRYNQSALMNRDYLQSALDDYERKRGAKHPMAEKSLNLVWVRVPDTNAFQKVAYQVEHSSKFTTPAVKCETASSGVASFLEPYRSLLWGVRWLFIPVVLVIMALVIAIAISIGVRERRTEIAVLKVLGFGPWQVLVLVLGEAMLIGVVGGLVSAGATWLVINQYFGGVKFPIAFFPSFTIPAQAWIWGVLIGGATAFFGSVVPAWSARSVKVAQVFSKTA